MINCLQEISKRLKIKELINKLEGIQELIIIPYLGLHQIPFAALPIDADQLTTSPPETLTNSPQLSSTFGLSGIAKKTEFSGTKKVNLQNTLGDKFILRFAPSLQMLNYCQERSDFTEKLQIGIVENATEDSIYAEFAGETLAFNYRVPDEQHLKGRKATVNNYTELSKKVNYIYSIHHGNYDLANPLNSLLLLYDGNLTLGQIMSPGWRRKNLVNVELFCCKTNFNISKNITDEPLSLGYH